MLPWKLWWYQSDWGEINSKTNLFSFRQKSSGEKRFRWGCWIYLREAFCSQANMWFILRNGKSSCSISLKQHSKPEWFCFHYRQQRSCSKVMILHLSVILFTGRGVRHPLGRHPPLRNAYSDTVNKRAVRILLECILVVFMFTEAKLVHFVAKKFRSLKFYGKWQLPWKPPSLPRFFFFFHFHAVFRQKMVPSPMWKSWICHWP